MEDDRKGLRKRIKGVESRGIVEKKGGLGSFLTVSLPRIIIMILVITASFAHGIPSILVPPYQSGRNIRTIPMHLSISHPRHQDE